MNLPRYPELRRARQTRHALVGRRRRARSSTSGSRRRESRTSSMPSVAARCVRSARASCRSAGKRISTAIPCPCRACSMRSSRKGSGDGYRDARLPPMRDAWRIGLAALDAESRARHELPFASIDDEARKALLIDMQQGELTARRMARHAREAFLHRNACCTTSAALITRIHMHGARSASAAPPIRAAMSACTSIGATRGKQRKPSPAKKTRPARRIAVSDDAQTCSARQARTRAGCLPYWRMGADARVCRRTKRSISRSSARARAAARSPAVSRRTASRSSRSMPGAWWRPLEEFASDETHQAKLFWTDERICDGENPLKLGNNNSGKAVGGSTVHFAMVSLRFRPEWFKSRSAARLRRGLAARLARDVALLRRSRGGAEDRRAR